LIDAAPGFFEILARGGAFGILVVLAAAVARGGATPARVTGGLFCLSAAAHVLQQNPVVLSEFGVFQGAIVLLSIPGAGLLWAYARELFEDHRRLDPRRFIPALVLLAIGLFGEAIGPTPLGRAIFLAHNLIAIALMVHVLIVVTTGWRGDLVEQRRRLRGLVLALAALYTLGDSLVESAAVLGTAVGALSPFGAASLLATSMIGAIVFLQADPDLFGASRRSRAAAADEPAASAQDLAVLAKLRKALDEDEVWRREALSIGELAGLVGAPEHRLRRLINAQLGYRNFAAFLNERRIAAAKQALADPARALTPISQIAYDAGFASLGPFNRAFKEATGSTPTAWRERALGADASPNPQIAR
jgi:AraC-like DNA-binding protein